MLGFLADWVLSLVLSRLLGASEYGDFRIGRAFAVFCGAVVLLGGDRAGPRALAVPLDEGRYSVAWEYLRFYGALGLFLSMVVIAPVWLSQYLVNSTWDPNVYHAVAIMALSIPFMALGALSGRTLQTVGFTFLAAMPWRVGAPILLISVLALMRWALQEVDLQVVLWAAVLTIATIALGQWVMVRRRALPKVEFASEAFTPRIWLRMSLPMMSAFLVTLTLAQSDLYFLEWLGGEESVGHYAAAASSAHFVLAIQTSIVAVFAPLIGRQVKSGTARMSTDFRRGQRVMTLAVAPVVLTLVVAATPIMRSFGPGFVDATPVLRLLSIGNGSWALAALSVLWMQYDERGVAVVRVTIGVLLVDSLLNVLLIPKFGMIGAAAGTVATSIGATIAVVRMRRGHQGLRGA